MLARIALGTWYVLLGIYAVLFLFTIQGGAVFPIAMAPVLLIAGVVSGAALRRRATGVTLVTLIVALVQWVVGNLLLRMFSATWHVDPLQAQLSSVAEYLPGALYVIGLVLPVATAAWAVRQIRNMRMPEPNPARA
jgi:hypothetical protein